jgi:hypothetical protein
VQTASQLARAKKTSPALDARAVFFRQASD